MTEQKQNKNKCPYCGSPMIDKLSCGGTICHTCRKVSA